MNITPTAYQLLEWIAISGEFPTDNLVRFGIGKSYGEKLVTTLKKERYIKTHYKDKLRGYRLTPKGKCFLLQQNAKRFSFYLSGTSDTNQPRSDYARRLRLHSASRTYCILANAGVTLFRDNNPNIFSGVPPDAPLETQMPYFPVYYHSREVKELGLETTKVNNSRAVGILFATHNIYIVFYTGASVLKWEYRTEVRLKALLSYHISQGILASWYHYDSPIHAILIGSTMETAGKLMNSTGGYRHSLFTLDTSFDSFYYIPDSHSGELVLKLLCNPSLSLQLDELLRSDLAPPDSTFGIEHDAMKDGYPVLFCYTFDMLRISHFVTALRLHKQMGHLICFDFHSNILQSYCGDVVTISTINTEKLERSLPP